MPKLRRQLDKKEKVKFKAPGIPHDVVVQILLKLPLKSLLRFSCVCKLWFNTIVVDHQRFNKAHYAESQKNPILIFTFQPPQSEEYYIEHAQPPKHWKYWGNLFYLEKANHGSIGINGLLLLRNIAAVRRSSYTDMVGYCNGLACFRSTREFGSYPWIYFFVEIYNPSRMEKLSIISRIRCDLGNTFGFQFGYDLLNNEYKVMYIMYCNEADVRDNDYNGYGRYYKYFIFTVGSSKPWRQIKHPKPKLHPIIYSEYRLGSKPPVSCNGTLFYEMVNDEEECELVSFDFHDEQFQVIKLPDDDIFVLPHNSRNFYQLEYEGCFCFARMEKFDARNGKVELYILKDNTEQVWVKETVEFYLPTTVRNPAPPCNYKYTTFSKTDEGITSIRIMCLSNQIFLYWRLSGRKDSHVIQLYNVHSKELKEVKHPSEGYRNSYDYHISSHIENSLSLKHLATAKGNTVLDEDNNMSSFDNICDLFSQTPESYPAVLSFYDTVRICKEEDNYIEIYV
ncbi:putative F-box protein At3g52320 [Papaver somniferum]|uniref:putative F-box protein At3g52320 n=1 Tax=Papaver somniferum TaxID=3469 RepID=UPI000E703089|nr:putative F-box protein At3g52320 [Papaver somniferum]